MFDHLDDPNPFVPTEELRASTVRRGRSLRRRRRALAGGSVAVLLALVGVAGATTMVERKLDEVDHVEVAALRSTAAPGDPKVILFVGADGPDPSDPDGSDGRTPPFRSDTMILARVDPGHETLALLPLPRDLLVDIPGHGQGRLNAAFAKGGPGLLVETIDQNLGIEVDHYAQTDFAGAVSIGEALDGLDLSFTTEVRDTHTGFHADAGCATFDGEQLLALSRTRHLDYVEDGSWVRDPTSDLGRIERQQAIGQALVQRLAELDASSPRAALDLVNAVSKHLIIDDETSTKELLGLFRAVNGSRTIPLRLPVTDARYGEAAVLEMAEGGTGVVEQFLGLQLDAPSGGQGTTTTLDPASTTTTAVTTTTIAPSVPSVTTPAQAIPSPC